MHNVIPFPASRTSRVPATGQYRQQITIDGEFLDDDMPPPLFDPDEDLSELNMYIQIAADSVAD